MPLRTDENFAQRWRDRPDRWSLVRRVIEDWWPPLHDSDGYSAAEIVAAERHLGIALPAAVREWYQMAGRRTDLCATQDRLIPPQELSLVDGDWCTIWADNQAVVLWDLHLSRPVPDHPALWDMPTNPKIDDDPPVYLNRASQVREQDAPSFTEFVVRMMLMQTVVTHPNVGSGFVTPSAVRPLKERYSDLGLAPSTWPSASTQFLGGGGAILVLGNDADASAWAFAAVATEQAAHRLRSAAGIRWDFAPAIRKRPLPAGLKE